MANSVDPAEMAHDERSHLELHCSERYLYWSVGKGLRQFYAVFVHANMYKLAWDTDKYLLRFQFLCRLGKGGSNEYTSPPPPPNPPNIYF